MSIPESFPPDPEPDIKPVPAAMPLRRGRAKRLGPGRTKPQGQGRAQPLGPGRTKSRRISTRVKVIAGSLVLLILLVGLGSGLYVYSFYQRALAVEGKLAADLKAGGDELQAGKDAVKKANTDQSTAPLADAKAHFEVARAHFQAAMDRAATDPTLRQAESYPSAKSYIAPRIQAVIGVSQLGIALCDAGKDTADIDVKLIQPDNPNLHGGERLIAVLKDTTPALDKVQTDLEQARKWGDSVNLTVLPSAQQATFTHAKESIQAGLDSIKEFKVLSPVILDVLGDGATKTYLVEQVDPAELRGSGGFIGSYSMLSANRGKMALGSSGDVYQIDYPYPVPGGRNYLPPPNSLKEFATHGYVFGDSNFWPDFPAAAQIGEMLFNRETGKNVDGVIAIDPYAVAQLLEVTGPISVPEYNATVNSKTFVEDVFIREETAANNVPGRKAFFPAVANRIIDKLSNLSSSDWSKLLGALNTAVTQRHMQVYFNKDTDQVEMGRIGWTGATLVPGDQHQEVIREVESNYGGNKANHFLERKYDLTLTVNGDRLHHKLTVREKNSTPPGFLGGQDYRAYYRLYYPDYAGGPRSGGLFADKYPSDEHPGGMKLLDGWYQMPPYSSHDLTFEWDTSAKDFETGGVRVYWEKQAGTLDDKIHLKLDYNGKTSTADTDLSQDRLVFISPDGFKVTPGLAGGAKLPVLSF